MKLAATLAASAALFLVASTASAQTVLNTDLPDLNGNFGGGVATTTTGANGTVTTVTGPGGGANRATATPSGPMTWYQANVGGGGSTGITLDYTNDGNGAAYFSTPGGPGTGAGKADLQLNFAAPVLLSSLKGVSFDFYVDPATQTTNGVYSPVLRFNMLKNGSFAGSLIFEYFYQGQTGAPEGQWLTQSATLGSGKWWTSNASLGPSFATAGGVKTLQEWIDDNANARIEVFGVNIGVGSGWEGNFAGAIDNVRFDFGTISGDYDFAVVPEPATWALMIGGFGLVGGALRTRRRTLAMA